MKPAEVAQTLRAAYDGRVDERDAKPPSPWEAAERDSFASLLEHEQKRTVVECGSAAGVDALALEARGLDVVCTDLSPAMVRRCREKGLTAHVMDVAELDFPPESFDAVYAMNCLVHVPKTRLHDALVGISRLLRDAGLFYVGVYGGIDFEGIRDDDPYEPKRFYAHHTDEDLQRIVTSTFDLLSFTRIPEGWNGLHFQSLVLRKRALDRT